jgi:hypothetical protein
MACLCGIDDAPTAQVGPGETRMRGQVRAEPTRRLMLAAAGACSVALAGCKGITALGALPKTRADVITLQHAITAEELMIARYGLAIAALPAGQHQAGGTGKSKAGADRAVVAALLAEHRQHLAQLRSRLILPPRLATASPQPNPTPPAAPAGRHRILAELAAAEAAASDRLVGWLPAVPPALAQLMASIAAAEAAHVVHLGYGRLAP